MNCNHISRLLAEGEPFDAQAREHIAGCRFCQALVESAFVQREELGAAQLERLKHVATQQLEAVRPLPSGRQLTFLLSALFLCLTVAAIYPAGSAGFRALTWWQSVVYYGAILLTAVFGADALVREMVPGTRRYVSPRTEVVLQCGALLAVVALLFHSLSTAGFVASGEGCLRVGSLCTLFSGIVFALIVHKGFFASPVRSGVLGGFLSGLVGFAVLAVHCGFLSIPHIWLWHFGVIPLGMAGGALAGFVSHKLSAMRNF